MSEPICTCPTGNGSLRWPCPVHPPEIPPVLKGGDGWQVTTIDSISQIQADTVVNEYKPTIHFVPIYGGTVALATTREEWFKLLELYGIAPVQADHNAAGRSMALVNEGCQSAYLIGVFNNELRTYVHEVAHTTLFICEDAGIDPTSSNGEPFCYLHDTLFDLMSEQMSEHIMRANNAKVVDLQE